MSDEIDIETDRLAKLNSQRTKRISEILSENADLEHKAVHEQIIPKNIFKKVQKDEANG